MTRVLVTRARDDAERTAEKLQRLGFTPLISPVIEIAATGAAIPDGAFDAVSATSARAIAHAGDGLDALASLPFYVVGARTARAAEERGMRVAATAPDVAGLIAMLREAPLPGPPPLRGRGSETRGRERNRETPIVGVHSPAERGSDREVVSPRRFLYLAGRDRKDDLERFLRDRGHSVSTVEVYEARTARALSDEANAALARREIGAVLHYSARSAAIFLELARAAGASANGPSSLPAERRNDGVTDMVHFALSEDVARPLRAAGCTRVRVAPTPDEESLLQLLRAL